MFLTRATQLAWVLFISMMTTSCLTESSKKQELPFYNNADFTAQWIDVPSARDTIHTIADFSFTDQNGNTITQKKFEGKIYVADFFFTRCPGICKQLSSNLAIVQKAFKDDKDVLLISHTVTPETDSAKKLKLYAIDFGVMDNKWFLVTGDKEKIYTLARRSYFADEDLGLRKNENDFLHTENVLLIDKHRHIRGIYKGTSPAAIQDLIADIKILKQE